MSRLHTTAAVGLLGGALLLTPAIAFAETGEDPDPRFTYGYSSGSLTELTPDHRFEHASGRAGLVGYRSTSVWLRLRGINTHAAGTKFGAHLHEGPCVEGKPLDALGHYNNDKENGETNLVATVENEVWLDFVVGDEGTASVKATVAWTPKPGKRAIVIHSQPTWTGDTTQHAHGWAGDRLACLPINIR